MKVYSYKDVDAFVYDLTYKHGYECIQIPGCLVDGYICIAPDDKHWNFVFRETYLNEWSSALTMRRCRKIPRALQKEINRLISDCE